jgi:hypothetical protein
MFEERTAPETWASGSCGPSATALEEESSPGYKKPLCSPCKARRFHFSVKKAKIQELLAPRRSSPFFQFLLFIFFFLCPRVRVRAAESEERCKHGERAFPGVSNRCQRR